MDKFCPVYIALLVLLVLYICACFVAIGILCKYPKDSQPKWDQSDSQDSGVDDSIPDKKVQDRRTLVKSLPPPTISL